MGLRESVTGALSALRNWTAEGVWGIGGGGGLYGSILIIATFILRTYPSREDVQGAYRSGYIKIGVHTL